MESHWTEERKYISRITIYYGASYGFNAGLDMLSGVLWTCWLVEVEE